MRKPKTKPCDCCKKPIPNKDNTKYCKNCARHIQEKFQEVYYLRNRVIQLGGKFKKPYTDKVEKDNVKDIK